MDSTIWMALALAAYLRAYTFNPGHPRRERYFKIRRYALSRAARRK